MHQPFDVESYGSYHTSPALSGREFEVRVELINGKAMSWKHQFLMDAVRQALDWRRHSRNAKIVDCEGVDIISCTRMRRLWRAAEGCYGTATHQTPYKVLGRAVCNRLEQYTSMSLINAIDFASGWYHNASDDPSGVELRGPNNGIVLSQKVVERMYYAELYSIGRTLTVSMVRPSDKVIVGPNGAVRLTEVLWEKRIV